MGRSPPPDDDRVIAGVHERITSASQTEYVAQEIIMGKKKRRLQVTVISLILFSIIGYLTYTGIRDTMAYYLTVSELLAKGPSAENLGLRVGGEVIPDSIQWNPRDLRLRFRIRDGESSLQVDYQGVVPDSFKPGKEVVVEGKYTVDGLFKATTIMPTCPSKYE